MLAECFLNCQGSDEALMILRFAFRLKPQLRLGVIANMTKSAVVGPANGGAPAISEMIYGPRPTSNTRHYPTADET